MSDTAPQDIDNPTFVELADQILRGPNPERIISLRDDSLDRLKRLEFAVQQKMRAGTPPGQLTALEGLLKACVTARDVLLASAQVGLQRLNSGEGSAHIVARDPNVRQG